MAETNIALGIDIGGTFTDVLALDRDTGQLVSTFKVLSNAENLAAGAVIGVDKFREAMGGQASAVFHGTTIGTNALITKQAARTSLVTTAGFRDVLALRRHARPRLYDLSPRISSAIVPRELRFEIAERMGHDGEILTPLTSEEVERIIRLVRSADVEAVAISLLHAYANDEHERTLGAALEEAIPNLFVTLSSDVCREFREFERTSTVVVNAFIGPVVQRYIDRLGDALSKRNISQLSIVKSNGGLTSAANACRYPVHLIESGPAAGVIACAALGAAEDLGDLISFDMGGTTAKAGVVVGGQPKLSTEFYADRFVDGIDVGGYPIQSPVIDLIEIGSGGGSIAWIDKNGIIKVGPDSAGAQPGPACYNRGGELPTVTDAHVVVGHISADGFGSEDLGIDPERARAAVESYIAEPFGWTVEQAAWGILRLANANITEIVRLATLRRGLDPRAFCLVAFGGAGPLHAAEIAREVGVPTVVLPTVPGLFSAVGTMLGEVRHDLVQTLLRRSTNLDKTEVTKAFAKLESLSRDLIAAENTGGNWHFKKLVDARFEGQLFELTLPLKKAETLTGDSLDRTFRSAHHETYGYDLPNHSVQLVNLRLVASNTVYDGRWPTSETEPDPQPNRSRRIVDVNGIEHQVTALHRSTLKPGMTIKGPMIIEDFGSTIRILNNQSAEVRPSGVLVVLDAEVDR